MHRLGRALTGPELTEEMIDEAMERAWKAICSPTDERCLTMPSDVANAQATCTPKGRCRIGAIVKDAGRTAWHVWLDLHTGEGRLRQWKD